MCVGGDSSHERHLSSVHSYVHRLRSVNLRVKQTVKLTEGAMHHCTCILVSGRSHGSQNQTGGSVFLQHGLPKSRRLQRFAH